MPFISSYAAGYIVASVFATVALLWSARLGNNHLPLGTPWLTRLLKTRIDPADVYAGTPLAILLQHGAVWWSWPIAFAVIAAYVKWGEPLLNHVTGDPYFTKAGVPLEVEDIRDAGLGFVLVYGVLSLFRYL